MENYMEMAERWLFPALLSIRSIGYPKSNVGVHQLYSAADLREPYPNASRNLEVCYEQSTDQECLVQLYAGSQCKRMFDPFHVIQLIITVMSYFYTAMCKTIIPAKLPFRLITRD